MFLCEQCGRTTKPGQPCYRVPVSYRPAVYPYRDYANRGGRPDNGGRGIEIVLETKVCENCAQFVQPMVQQEDLARLCGQV